MQLVNVSSIYILPIYILNIFKREKRWFLSWRGGGDVWIARFNDTLMAERNELDNYAILTIIVKIEQGEINRWTPVIL